MMAEILDCDSFDASYSTRTCRRCDIAMLPRHDGRRRVWRCPACGREER